MTRSFISQANVGDAVLRFTEQPFDAMNPPAMVPLLGMDIFGQEVAIGLADLRRMKRALAAAEGRLMLREEQVARARNLTLEL